MVLLMGVVEVPAPLEVHPEAGGRSQELLQSQGGVRRFSRRDAGTQSPEFNQIRPFLCASASLRESIDSSIGMNLASVGIASHAISKKYSSFSTPMLS